MIALALNVAWRLKYIALLSLSGYYVYTYYQIKNKPKATQPVTLQVVKQKIQAAGIRHPEVVYAQAILETDSLRSNIFKENSNLFGMKPSTRHKKANRGHAQYDGIDESIADYKAWQKSIMPLYEKRIREISSNEDYLVFLCGFPVGNGYKMYPYAEDPAYIKKLRFFLKKDTQLQSKIK